MVTVLSDGSMCAFPRTSKPFFWTFIPIRQPSLMANRHWQLSMLNSSTGLHPYSSSFWQDLTQWSSSLLPSLASHPKTPFETTTNLVFLINFCIMGLPHEDFFFPSLCFLLYHKQLEQGIKHCRYSIDHCNMNEWAVLKYTYKNPLSLIDAELTAFIILLTSVFLTFSFITLCSKVCVLYAEGHSGKMTYTLGFFFFWHCNLYHYTDFHVKMKKMLHDWGGFMEGYYHQKAPHHNKAPPLSFISRNLVCLLPLLLFSKAPHWFL